MEEETIFNNNNPSSGQIPQQPQGVPPIANPPVSSAPPVPPPPPPEFVDHGQGAPLKKFLKIGAVIAFALLMVLIVVALIVPRFTKPKVENITLTYWGQNIEQNQMIGIINEFESENPNIKVEYIKQDPEEYRDKLSFRIPKGTGPDIFRYHNSWYPQISNILAPIPNEVIDRQDFESSYYKVIQEDLIKNGGIYGIPLEVDTLALFVNTSLLPENEVPTNWQDFITKSQTLTKRTDDGKIDVSGAAIGTYENINHAPDLISLLFAQNGVSLSDISKSESKVADALSFYTNFALLENNTWDQTLEPSLTYFSKGKVAMIFGYARDLKKIKNENPDLAVKVFPVPQLLQDRKVNIASYWAEGLSSNSKHQKEGLLFMKFLAKKETQKKLDDGEPYSNIDLLSSLSDTLLFVHADQANNAVSSYLVDETYDNGMNEKLNAYLKDTVNSILSNNSVEDSVKTLLDGFNQVKADFGF